MANDLRSRLDAAANGAQRADVSLRFGNKVTFDAGATMTAGGLLAVAVLVSTILLSTSLLVGSARRKR
ncbi:hypothetical protein [Sphingomonas nostoxanthinifaciens]|uniref:hypothetical protein n=1 Tax=Sphingomonas nostoxanthinifaciens TaxID=2872652 RepID=UPI001CC1C326|nr:hypothetical protein [Sphingomonas nostoxanthinifaciens]UAK25232.1 hypothetical protein K8P63_03280 [Sphingomonas nostoxanthinifaciens]